MVPLHEHPTGTARPGQCTERQSDNQVSTHTPSQIRSSLEMVVCNLQLFRDPGTPYPCDTCKTCLSLQQTTAGSCWKDLTLHRTSNADHHDVDPTAKAAGPGTEFGVLGRQDASVLFRTLQQKMYVSLLSHLSFTGQVACSRAHFQAYFSQFVFKPS